MSDDIGVQKRKSGRPKGAKDKKPRKRRTKKEIEEARPGLVPSEKSGANG